METSVEALKARFQTVHNRSLPRECDRLEVVKRIAGAIPDMDESFTRATRLVAQLIGTPFAAFSLVGSTQQMVKAAFGVDAGESGEEGLFCRLCVARNELLVVPDASQDPLFRDNPMVTGPLGLRFYAGMPVRAPDGTTVGTLCVVDQKPGRLSIEQERVLYDMRSMVEELIALRALSVHDPLTGLHNRRYFDEQLALEWKRRQRSGDDLSIVMIDIDYFKLYNDAYGHPCGDSCLQQLAHLLREHVRRAGEVAARYGGEEFIVLMPRTSTMEAADWASRFCLAVAAMNTLHEGSPFGRLTASAGCATVEGLYDREFAPLTLVKNADAALYRSKRAGRSQATSHGACTVGDESPPSSIVADSRPRRSAGKAPASTPIPA